MAPPRVPDLAVPVTTNARLDADRLDARQLDRYPVCPQCGNVCGLLAYVCADCQTRLRPTAAELHTIAADAKIRRMNAALEREAMATPEGKAV